MRINAVDQLHESLGERVVNRSSSARLPGSEKDQGSKKIPGVFTPGTALS